MYIYILCYAQEALSVLQYVITEVTKCRKLFENEMKGNAEAKKIHRLIISIFMFIVKH